MSIVYIDQTGQLGGGELSLLDWLTARPSDSHVILFADGPFRSLIESIGISVEVLQIDSIGEIRRSSTIMALFGSLSSFSKLRRRLRASLSHGDILYANSQKAFLLTALSKRLKQPLIWHLRDLLTPDHFSPILIRLAVFMGNHFATVIMVNSQSTADAFVVAGGRLDKVRLVPDGIDSLPFDRVTSSTMKELHAELCPPGRYLIGLFGRLAFWKGQHIMLEAAARLPDVQVCLVGDALFGEQEYAATLRERAERPDLAGRVQFLGFRNDIAELMSAMDLIVHSSVSAEPLGRVILEGMLAYKPVIATRAGGAAEVIVDGESGMLISPGSIEDLHDAITRLKNDTTLAAEFAQAGRDRAVSVYSLRHMVERTEGVIREVAGRNNL